MRRYGYTYMMANRKNGTIYLGVTSDLAARVEQHRTRINPKCFTAIYGTDRLVWWERFDLIVDAIAREKRMKKYKREWKINLIEEMNPDWKHLTLAFDE